MMKLYRMEMYKLCHKKLFLAGAAITAALMVFYYKRELGKMRSGRQDIFGL